MSHQRSSGKMEVDSIIEMFKRSEKLYGMKDEYYMRDGDAKTISAIKNS